MKQHPTKIQINIDEKFYDPCDQCGSMNREQALTITGLDKDFRETINLFEGCYETDGAISPDPDNLLGITALLKVLGFEVTFSYSEEY